MRHAFNGRVASEHGFCRVALLARRETMDIGKDSFRRASSGTPSAGNQGA